MKKVLRGLAAFGVLAALTVPTAMAQENPAEPTHFPIKEPPQLHWSFAGPFGTFDKQQLQRGLKVYKEVCSACHSLNRVAFRNLADLGYSDAQVKAFASGLKNPRSVYVLPNGDVLVAETDGPREPVRRPKEFVMNWIEQKAHSSTKAPNDIVLAATYVASLRGKNIPGKPPEGEEIPPWGSTSSAPGRTPA